MNTLICFLVLTFAHSSAFAEATEVEYKCVFSATQTRDQIQVYGVYRVHSGSPGYRPLTDVYVRAEDRSGNSRLTGPTTERFNLARTFGLNTARIYRDGRRFNLNATEQNGSTIEVSPGEGNGADAFVVLNLKETATRPAYVGSGDGKCTFL